MKSTKLLQGAIGSELENHDRSAVAFKEESGPEEPMCDWLLATHCSTLEECQTTRSSLADPIGISKVKCSNLILAPLARMAAKKALSIT
ncbi:hypothetical protein N7450_011666 [Penicillium hetheringtonii]|uniref:Uncharacterized protein n=1 Tax=Penicillium hetheringtonii TaxID=911720 RepID=A0AAD6GNH4_9EURO|nr:hypothetical protein N7450_011666 [Penicillium hetheringtonii]